MSQPPTHDDLSRLKNKQCETEHHMVYGHHPNTIHDPMETIRLNNIATVELAMIYAYGAGQQTMPGSCLDPWEILPMIQCASGTPPGCFIEVGVYKGGSAWHLTKLAKVQERDVFGADGRQATEKALEACEQSLEAYAARVYAEEAESR